MVTFIVLAAILAALAAGLVAVPLLRHGAGSSGPAAPWAALASIALVVFGAAVLYVKWSNWTWSPQAVAAGTPRHGTAGTGDASAQEIIGQLARRLEKQPDDLAGWMMLGRSYAATEQYALAERAYARADQLAGGKDPEALAGLAETLLMQDENALSGRAGELFEQVLRLEPQMPKALFFGGIAALRRGELPLARDRFAQLLAGNPPENVRPLLQQQLDAIDAQLGRAPAAATGAAPARVTPGGAATAAASPASAAPAGEASVRVTLDVAPGVRGKIAASAPLFVFVRDPAAPGPPLAVKRLAAQFPQDIDLTAADSMTGDAALAPGRDVTVVARVSLGGMPNARSGDPFGEIRYRIGKDRRVKLTIDRITP